MIALFLRVKRWAAIAVAILGATCAVVAFADMTNVAGPGIYLTLAGGLVAGAGIVAARRPRPEPIGTPEA